MPSKWIAGLNPEQAEAVNHTDGPMLILAGAGSGKTTVLVQRAGRLIDEEGVPPSKLCILTFTNRAGRELVARVSAKVPRAGDLVAGTFHSFGLNLLRKFYEPAGLPKAFGIIDSSDQLRSQI